jgi:ketosteroid isomerase-like protein
VPNGDVDPNDPTAVLQRLMDGVCGRQGASLAELYAPDAVVTRPFATDGASVLRGRDQLAAHFARSAAVERTMAVRQLVIHRTTDPEVVVAEFEYHGQVTGDDPFVVGCVFVVRVRDGLIVESRDYASVRAEMPPV